MPCFSLPGPHFHLIFFGIRQEAEDLASHPTPEALPLAWHVLLPLWTEMFEGPQPPSSPFFSP